jgi:ATP-dependent DNA ligase
VKKPRPGGAFVRFIARTLKEATPKEGHRLVFEPSIDAEIEFRVITSDGMLRHVSFKGLK